MSSVVIAETGEVVDLLTADEAERITQRISIKLGTLADTYESVMPMLREAITRGAHKALGYSGVSAYISDRFGDTLPRLGIEMRTEVAREMSRAGMSVRSIAPVLGIGKSQVAADLSGVQNWTPEPAESAAPQWQSASSVLQEQQSEPQAPPIPVVAPTPIKTIGLDGKSYTRPEPTTPRRRPLNDAFKDTLYDLDRKVDSLRRLIDDDRFGVNADAIASDNYARVKQTANTLAEVLAALEAHR